MVCHGRTYSPIKYNIRIRHGMWFCESSVWIYASISSKSIRERRWCGTQRVPPSKIMYLLYPIVLLYYIGT